MLSTGRFIALLLVLLTLLVEATWQAAPGDEDAACVAAARSEAPPYSPARRVLMDTYNYRDLLTESEGGGSVWRTLDVAGEGQGWSQTSDPCQRSVRVCNLVSDGLATAEHWILTQPVSFLDASAVFVQLTLVFTDCSDNPVCTVTSFNVLVYQTHQERDIAVDDLTSFDLVSSVNGNQESPSTFSFQPDGNSSLFYLGIMDVGACVSISRVLLYYTFEPSTETGLVKIPELALPSIGTVSVFAVCAENATNVTSLEVFCNASGDCVGSPMCACDAGFEFNEATTQCTVCPAGTMKTTVSNDDACVWKIITQTEYVTNTVTVTVLGALLGATILIIIVLLVAIVLILWRRTKDPPTTHQVADLHSGVQHLDHDTRTGGTQPIVALEDMNRVIFQRQPSTATSEHVESSSITGIEAASLNDPAASEILIAKTDPPPENVVTCPATNTPPDTTTHTATATDNGSFKDTEEWVDVKRSLTPETAPPESSADEVKRSLTPSPEPVPQNAQRQDALIAEAVEGSNGASEAAERDRSSSFLSRAGQAMVGVASAVARLIPGTPTYGRSDSTWSNDPAAVNEGAGFTLTSDRFV